MTEQQWLACAEPRRMLTLLRERASGRKLRLFAVACCRRVLHLLDEAHRAAADIAEEWADTPRRGGLHAARRVYWPAGLRIMNERVRATTRSRYCLSEARRWASSAVWEAARPNPSTAAQAHRAAARAVEWRHKADEEKRRRSTSPLRAGEDAAEARAQADLLRDIFGNPFRRPRVKRAWLKWAGGTVVAVARAAYEGRAFDRLPILADALEEAGCTDPDVLGHCRRPGEHVRGCWVLDLLLGKE
jgi:hypothetical protein